VVRTIVEASDVPNYNVDVGIHWELQSDQHNWLSPTTPPPHTPGQGLEQKS
jgi:hypothetical protein